MRSRLVVFALASLATPLAAQSPPPLGKTELIRLLRSPLFAQPKRADVVRRSCLPFRPTERDWADLRTAGASGEVIASAAACDSRRASSSSATSSSGETAQPVTAVAQPIEVVTTAGASASVGVHLRGGRPPPRRTTPSRRGTT